MVLVLRLGIVSERIEIVLLVVIQLDSTAIDKVERYVVRNVQHEIDRIEEPLGVARRQTIAEEEAELGYDQTTDALALLVDPASRLVELALALVDQLLATTLGLALGQQLATELLLFAAALLGLETFLLLALLALGLLAFVEILEAALARVGRRAGGGLEEEVDAHLRLGGRRRLHGRRLGRHLGRAKEVGDLALRQLPRNESE